MWFATKGTLGVEKEDCLSENISITSSTTTTTSRARVSLLKFDVFHATSSKRMILTIVIHWGLYTPRSPM